MKVFRHPDAKETVGSNEDRNRPIFRSMDNAIGVIYQSEFSKQLIEIHGNCQKKPWCVIPNGVDRNEFSCTGSDHREYLGIKREDRVIVTSASWRAHKRLKDVLEVFLTLATLDSNLYHLVIMGLPDVAVPEHPRIYKVGHVDPTELAAWYRTGDVFVYLSWLDNCPNTVIEALACGLPVVCTNQGGTGGIVERTNGGIVVEADEPYLFNKVDLYNPPRPHIEGVIEAVLEIFRHYDRFRKAINYERIDIDGVAREYVRFVEYCLASYYK